MLSYSVFLVFTDEGRFNRGGVVVQPPAAVLDGVDGSWSREIEKNVHLLLGNSENLPPFLANFFPQVGAAFPLCAAKYVGKDKWSDNIVKLIIITYHNAAPLYRIE